MRCPYAAQSQQLDVCVVQQNQAGIPCQIAQCCSLATPQASSACLVLLPGSCVASHPFPSILQSYAGSIPAQSLLHALLGFTEVSFHIVGSHSSQDLVWGTSSLCGAANSGCSCLPSSAYWQLQVSSYCGSASRAAEMLHAKTYPGNGAGLSYRLDKVRVACQG